jgi:putative aminopeptidase FrvX
MSKNLPVDQDYMVDLLTELLNIPSPTGFTEQAMARVEAAIVEFGLKPQKSEKGFLAAEWSGEASSTPRALIAHIDTLGAMVKEIKSSGRLKLTQLGGYAWNTVEGEGCTVITASGKSIQHGGPSR